LENLNLPAFEYKIKKQENKPFIWDEIRKKHVLITPEEWVRQHFIHFLIGNNYPKTLISVETGLKYNQLQKRSDILVLDRFGEPFFLIECKAPKIKIDQKVLNQAIFYNQVIKAPFVGLTNGLQHFFCGINFESGKVEVMKDLPIFPA
jgi:hypothetical protein